MIGVTLVGLAVAALAPASTDSDSHAIVVTATKRATPIDQVPLAITAKDAADLHDSGASDIRQLSQLVPSLLVSSSSNEAGGGGARIRGIGTVGDNAGLESSVATYVDGVYRARAAVALTELGAVDQIEVLRGPQGTLFGRNASAGLISITTPAPRFTTGGYADLTLGNYAAKRIDAGLTGPIAPNLAFRIDGVYSKRRGFMEDVTSGRHINNRDRWLVRGKLLWKPDDTLSATLIGDIQRRKEECCAGVYLPTQDLKSSTPGVAGGSIIGAPSSIAALIRAQGGQVLDANPYARKVALSPGQSFRQDVHDGGLSLDVEKSFGGITLSAITAWRGNRFIKGQDADFSSLDLIERASDGSGFIRFRNFSQEVRLRGKALRDRLDWLVGGYVGDEHLTLQDNMRYGADYDRFASARIGALGGNFAAFPTYGFANLNGFANAFGGPTVAAAVQNVPITGTGELDRFRQHDTNVALFTHDIVHLTDRLSLTLGARWTRDRKSLNADLASSSSCGIYVADIARLRALGTAAATTLANSILAPLAGYPCNINSVSGNFRDTHVENNGSGTAALSYRVTQDVETYASWSRGYKAGGFNLDRAALFNSGALTQLPTDSLHFKPETVDAFELGAKLHRRAFDLDIALFHQVFRNFQLNSYTGTNFIVSNVEGCTTGLGATDSDNIGNNSACSSLKSGVVSKGVELEAALRPVGDVTLTAGFTYADTRYRGDIVGSPDALTGNNSLSVVLFRLPGSHLSNAPAYTATGSVRWNPAVSDDLRALFYADVRWQSRFNTGSDLLVEKEQAAFATVNARIGLEGRRWSLEFWAQNLFNTNYLQVGFSEPLQGGGSGGLPGTATAVSRFGSSSTQLFGAFLGEPRTWGGTLGWKF
ncbi:outer membrane receptor protein involved in Fe transport [Sphingomonas vulcanisoli]|uniref:Outer membrane receptor protein involved in Fe transport n=1 Tax=Sphingomonas vulcanisoli TaxID=1658060 RepID=A0ABX0TTJ5_9SPHN|nr:TonB-dependent receptor [Sphingomonas vulcanisoli]NIJ06926.1 outer membrane receptor protein involved in Fe transport [Sphingomonas vulcanisoli]